MICPNLWGVAAGQTSLPQHFERDKAEVLQTQSEKKKNYYPSSYTLSSTLLEPEKKKKPLSMEDVLMSPRADGVFLAQYEPRRSRSRQRRLSKNTIQSSHLTLRPTSVSVMRLQSFLARDCGIRYIFLFLYI